jgi:hypothetical protein
VEDVLENAGEDRPGGDGSRVAIGQTAGGRYLRVAYVRDRSRTVPSLLPRTSCAVNRFWRIVEGRGESIDETKPLPSRLE